MIRLTIPEIGDEEVEAVAAVLRSGYLVQGRHVQEFERLVSEYVGTKHAVAVSSGTCALHLALIALGIGPGDEVIVPDFTFPATANVVELVGATPILIDVDLATFNMDE
jgi:perosamine synthetase